MPIPDKIAFIEEINLISANVVQHWATLAEAHNSALDAIHDPKVNANDYAFVGLDDRGYPVVTWSVRDMALYDDIIRKEYDFEQG